MTAPKARSEGGWGGGRGAGGAKETLHAEWTKLRTVASTGWLLLGAAMLTVAVSTAVDAAVTCPSSG